jgi:hypothetical protein
MAHTLACMMNDQHWKLFFEACANVLGSGGHRNPAVSTTWCAWTLFDRLSSDLHYWTCGLPALKDVGDTHIKDGGVWGQPFLYSSLAHVVVPRQFDWEAGDFKDDTHSHGTKTQDLDGLSTLLSSSGIPHRLTDLVLEVKLY